MRYIQTFDTLEQALKFKAEILAQKSEEPHRYMLRVKDQERLVVFMDTDWKIPEKPVVFDFQKESISTMRFINILLENGIFNQRHVAIDKKIYEDDIKNVTTFKNIFSGSVDTKTLNLIKSKNIVNDMSCVEKFVGLIDISGISEAGEYQNFFGAVDIIKIKLPDTIKTIGKSAFAFCMNLEEIKLSKNVESVMSKAFYNCTSLKNIEFPNTLKKLDSMIFSNSSVTNIILNSTVPPTIMKTTFKGMDQDFIVFVPEKSYENYIQQWSIIADHIVPNTK